MHVPEFEPDKGSFKIHTDTMIARQSEAGIGSSDQQKLQASVRHLPQE
jgi:hypothetical protein